MGQNVSNACPNACKKSSHVQPTTSKKFKGKICQRSQKEFQIVLKSY